MRYFVTFAARETAVDVTLLPDGGWDVRLEGRRIPVDAVSIDGTLSILVNGQGIDLQTTASPPNTIEFATYRGRGDATIESERTRAAPSAGGAARANDTTVRAPMPGRIVRLLVAPGDRVKAGTPLIVIEAMKMENELRAVHTATVARILVEPGVTVEAGAKLVELE